jgi:hypothetical protein
VWLCGLGAASRVAAVSCCQYEELAVAAAVQPQSFSTWPRAPTTPSTPCNNSRCAVTVATVWCTARVGANVLHQAANSDVACAMTTSGGMRPREPDAPAIRCGASDNGAMHRHRRTDVPSSPGHCWQSGGAICMMSRDCICSGPHSAGRVCA